LYLADVVLLNIVVSLTFTVLAALGKMSQHLNWTPTTPFKVSLAEALQEASKA
jgi:hypothetical protein